MGDRLERRGDHLVWNGNKKCTGRNKIPIIQVRNRIVYVHRVMWELEWGEGAAESVHLKRTCQEMMCVDPAHFKVVRNYAKA